ncbi:MULTISPECIES: type II toxin-antitoxin system RelE/ParE family toxin [Nostoc]|uniref:Type II toxin-antitoxin system RelE/ParE family toxin n=1 Tax=Nostoc paludosum FACHB-159 TaxID=2692908 RepID=A0ABR8K190_9NOSO|nr:MULTISPECIES: type II toxin-antitoxin system RelE/ParE family toxin [Nostoc]MBD2676990.1 type II toxin-antitoxin system RelE/ParE family toxin [Nostoc sp. FACHB-857]MBD2733190.1 type II toxin-antitoxin system RelE/ParE family toxin [Nostoc paludosum FACHB-159]
MIRIVFHPSAEQELVDATNYYEEKNQGLGLDFLTEVENAVNLLMRYPAAGVVVQGFVRRLILPKFPYSLLYRVVDDDLIRILAIAHHKRKPLYWISRE